jgi:hypothetical protein
MDDESPESEMSGSPLGPVSAILRPASQASLDLPQEAPLAPYRPSLATR